MKYTLITGASRGIGEAMARYCAGKGFNLILIARSLDKLNELSEKIRENYKVDVKVFVIDFTDSAAPQKIYQWCLDNQLSVNMLINNVGVGLYGKFCDLKLQAQLDLIQLNQITTISMTHYFLPMLSNQNGAYVLNVASTACYQPIPYMSVYAATQSFIQSYSLAMREELKHKKVYVSCLCPGPTATDFFDRAGLDSLPVNSSEIKMSSDEVVEAAIEGMLDKVSEIVPGTSNTIGAYFSKLLPNKWVVRAVSALFAPKT